MEKILTLKRLGCSQWYIQMFANIPKMEHDKMDYGFLQVVPKAYTPPLLFSGMWF